jgi:hypothetical protein
VKVGWLRASDTTMGFYPVILKMSRGGNFPDAALAKNPNGTYATTPLGEKILLGAPSGWITFKDQYEMRLAETYLLRAEAYLGNNQKDKAAADINVVRTRAHATPTPTDGSQIDIDYILDERARELYAEELRNMTLFRLGKFVDRSRRYNGAGHLTGDHQNLWPIPFEDIEKNILAVLEQNPGY